MTLRIGSLCTGYGGLTLAVHAVFGGELAWYSEIEPAACRLLEARFPGVPNLGDMTEIDWENVEPVDVMDAGTPCQDVSGAGKRRGMKAGTRSGLWSSMVDGIDVIRPQIVVWENVRGVLSADADCDVESCPGCVGDGPDRVNLRALGRVLGDLADSGYDAEWCGLHASGVGAPHPRFRVFVVARNTQDVIGERGRAVPGLGSRNAWPTRGAGGSAAEDADVAAGGERRVAAPGSPEGRRPWADARGRGGALDPGQDLSDSAGERVEGGDPSGAPGSTSVGRSAVGCVASDAQGVGRGEGWPEPAGKFGGSDAAVGGGEVDPDTDSDGLAQLGYEPTDQQDPDGRGGPRAVWGAYEPAVRRWESVTGIPAPAPTELSVRGGQRLAPRFVEWMMGLEPGWVTGVPGISRNDQLKLLGNGVVRQQAVAAIQHMRDREPLTFDLA